MSNRAQAPGADLFGLSQALWGQVPADLLQGYWGDRDIGWMRGDDFSNFAKQVALSSNVGYATSEGNTYRTWESNGGSGTSAQCIVPSNSPWTVPSAFNVYSPNGGAILYPGGSVIPTPGQIAFTPTATTDQGQLVLAPDIDGTINVPTGLFNPYPISSGVQGAVFFECRLQLSSLTTAFTSFFAGLVGAGAAVGATSNPVGASAFSTTPSLLGFGCLKGDSSGQIGLVYSKAGGPVSDQATNSALNLLTLGSISRTAAPVVSVAGPGGIPASAAAVYEGAYLKLGFKYDPASGIFTPYINGVAQDGRVAPNKTLGSSVTTSSTVWPADQMTFGAGLYQTGATYQKLTIDWWRAAQLAG